MNSLKLHLILRGLRNQNKFPIDKYNREIYLRKKKQLRKSLNIGENVLVMAKWKKSAPGNFYKQAVQNVSYFNKGKIFAITNQKNIDNKAFY